MDFCTNPAQILARRILRSDLESRFFPPDNNDTSNIMKNLILACLALSTSSLCFGATLGAFDPFAFQEAGSCADSAHLSFNYLKPEMVPSLGNDAQNRPILYAAQVAVAKNGNFRITSQEYVMQGDQMIVLKTEKISGSAKVSTIAANQLELTDDQGKAWGGLLLTDMQVDPFGQAIYLFVFGRNDSDGQPLTVGTFYEKAQPLGPFMESSADYCKSPL